MENKKIVYLVEVYTHIGERVIHSGGKDMIAGDLPAAMGYAENMLQSLSLTKYYDKGFPWIGEQEEGTSLGTWKLEPTSTKVRVIYSFMIKQMEVSDEEN